LSPDSDDFLRKLAESAWSSIDSGYYETVLTETRLPRRSLSLRRAVESRRGRAIVAEVKFASPVSGPLRTVHDEPSEVAKSMVAGGAVALSVLTEPTLFRGSLNNFRLVRKAVDVPLLMKDLVVSTSQIEAAPRLGADAVLLIQSFFDKGFCDSSVEDMITLSHKMGLEVVLETHTEEEFTSASETDADLIGINNRDLSTMKISFETSLRLLSMPRPSAAPVLSESGISSASDIRLLRAAGADGFLVGTSIMQADDVEAKVRELAEA